MSPNQNNIFTSTPVKGWTDIQPYTIAQAECIQWMRENLKDNSVDAILTDPPYGIGFMNREWDSQVPALEWAQECLRVLKHGGHILSFASTRTYHRLAVNLEDAGFEIRDMVSWAYYSGFPKSMSIEKEIDRLYGKSPTVVGQRTDGRYQYEFTPNSSWHNQGDFGTGNKGAITEPTTQQAKEWKGYGTNLKPSFEPACLARKPLSKNHTIAQNVLKWGVGAINIDDCRLPYNHRCWIGPKEKHKGYPNGKGGNRFKFDPTPNPDNSPYFFREDGRWPANIYHCPKPSRKEREEGLSHLQSVSGCEAVQRKEGSAGLNNPRAGAGRTATEVRNHHPCVKPIDILRWMCRLIGAKKGNVILDPFAGSGSTGVAALLEGYKYIGIELDNQYIPIIKGRMQNAITTFQNENAQMKLFGD